MNEQDVRDFLLFLKKNNMEIAGYTRNRLLGMQQLRPLAEEDESAVIEDFLKERLLPSKS